MRTETPTEVMVVEDDPDGLASLVELLEDEGYRVIGVRNGSEALKRLEAGARPALILLDLMTPVMNGWQFREQQRAMPHLSQIPVVIMSANREVGQAAKALDAAGFVAKPLHVDDLLDQIARFAAPKG